MALPDGVTTATVTAGVPVTHIGAPVKAFLSIEPSAFLVHTATGTPLVDFLEEQSINEGVAGQFTLPHTDQAGFQDENGNAYTNWYYTARITYSTPSKAKTKAPKVKVFQLATGQTVVDLDSLPGGAPALPYTTPIATVTSINGRTGPVTILDGDLPERLSEEELSATYGTPKQDKAESRNFVNMGKLPGAVGDGVTDNTTVFQAAIDRVGNDSPSTVFYFPAGTWLSDGLKAKSNCTFLGEGAGTFGLDSFNGLRTSILKLKANATRAMFSDYGTSNLSSGVTIRDLALDGNKTNQTLALCAIEQYPAASGQDPLWKVSRVYIRNFKGDGIKVGLYRRAMKIMDCEILSSDGHGINIDATDCTVQNCAIGQNGADGIHYTGGLQHCIGNDIWGNTNGISLGPLAQCAMIMNCGIDINRRHGITTEAPRTIIAGCTFQTNGIEANDTYSHIDLGYPSQTAIGCVISAVAMRHDSTVSANKAKYGVQPNVPVTLSGVGYNAADVPWVSGLAGNPAMLVLTQRSQGFADGTTLHMGLGGAGGGIKLGGGTSEKMAFWGATPIVRPTLTNAAATDLATTTLLVNELRSKLVSLGLVQ